jgi:RimJ/RimL family protein N-acetyltransferase
VILVALPGNVQPVQPALHPDETCIFHENEAGDLLKWTGKDYDTSERIAQLSESLAMKAPDDGGKLHTVLVRGRLAGWGWSFAPFVLPETWGLRLFDPPLKAVALIAFYTIPEFRGRKLYQALLAHILMQHFSDGEASAYIDVNERNQISLQAIRRVGFRPVARYRSWRFLKWRRTVITRIRD